MAWLEMCSYSIPQIMKWLSKAILLIHIKLTFLTLLINPLVLGTLFPLDNENILFLPSEQ